VTVLAAVLAGSSTNSTSSINEVTPGLLGFLVVAALCVACVFLFRSMNKQFRKIGPKPEETEAEGASAAARQRPLRGLAAHRAAMAAAEAAARRSDANRD
jgi:hypothetical protein